MPEKSIKFITTARDYYIPTSVSGFTRKQKLTDLGAEGTEACIQTLEGLYDSLTLFHVFR